jgi:hypothetical protein
MPGEIPAWASAGAASARENPIINPGIKRMVTSICL